ncbi:MAG: nucleotide exchange factor GrpE [Oscillospiraceae bacterium]|jgi:molecular chaperone GrpE|nr:nucleotide exchange factor GrpE [Oscillospiraceae bacterium]
MPKKKDPVGDDVHIVPPDDKTIPTPETEDRPRSAGEMSPQATEGATPEGATTEGATTEGATNVPPDPTPDELLAAERDKYLRLAAEYDNFRKRSRAERESLYTDIRAETVTRLLPVYDNLARALQTPCADEAFLKGVELTFTQFTEILTSLGVEEIPTVGEKFDPERHNAVSQTADPDAAPGVVTLELQKGFTLGGKIIRHAMVQVAQ